MALGLLASQAGAEGARREKGAGLPDRECLRCHGDPAPARSQPGERVRALYGDRSILSGVYHPRPRAEEGRGEHNVEYAVKLAQAGAARVDGLLTALDPKAKAIPRDDLLGQKDAYCFPLCHRRLPFKAEVTLEGKKLPHQLHVDSGVGCGTCHSVSKHKAPALDRRACQTCHPPPS